MTYRSLIDQVKFKYSHAVQTMEEERLRVKEAKVTLALQQQAVEIVQLVAQAVQQAVHSKIASVVSNCLEAVFDEPYTFHIEFERKRNRTEALLEFERNGLRLDPMSASGGGTVDVATFALRVACLVLRKDIEQTLILDEPFRFLSKDLHHRLRPLLEGLSKDLGVQFIIVSHMDALRIGKVVEL